MCANVPGRRCNETLGDFGKFRPRPLSRRHRGGKYREEVFVSLLVPIRKRKSTDFLLPFPHFLRLLFCHDFVAKFRSPPDSRFPRFFSLYSFFFIPSDPLFLSWQGNFSLVFFGPFILAIAFCPFGPLCGVKFPFS